MSSGARRKWMVAIDGPAGSGKSTIAKMLAQELNYRYVDTGAMYRAVTWKALKDRVALSDADALTRVARGLGLRLTYKNGVQKVDVEGEDVTQRIRTERVSQATSRVSAVPGVRRVLRQKQRRIGRLGGVVMEGRDIGTAVFPDADIKFYLDASSLERARRRYEQLKARGQRVKLSHIADAIRHRDQRDRHRGISPLQAAQDAVIVDSTIMTPHDVVRFMMGAMASRLGGGRRRRKLS